MNPLEIFALAIIIIVPTLLIIRAIINHYE